jgi:hypothetical protein
MVNCIVNTTVAPTALPTVAPTASPSTYLRASTVMQGSGRFYPSDGGLNECLSEGAPLFNIP